MRVFLLILCLLAISDVAAREADEPEPPGATQVRHLVGKWRSVRLLSKGKTTERATIVYTFGRDEFTYSSESIHYKGTIKVVSKRTPLVLAMTREKSTATLQFAARFEKDHLYLAVVPSGQLPKQIDITGNSYSVLVLKREKE